MRTGRRAIDAAMWVALLCATTVCAGPPAAGHTQRTAEVLLAQARTTTTTTPGGGATACTARPGKFVVDGSGPSLFVSNTITVARDVHRVAQAIDPQSWDECSKFWMPKGNATYLAHLGPGGTVVRDPALPPGTAYGGSLGTKQLFEHFGCNGGGCDASVDNLLAVTTWWDTVGGRDRYSVAYSLAKWLKGQVAGVPEEIVIDQGSVTAEDDGSGGTTVTVRKQLAYKDASLTGIAEGILNGAEATSDFSALVCCPVAGP